MKYFVMLGDGMADYRIPELGNKTPLEKAYKPTMDLLAKRGANGKVMTVPEGMVPESDTANLAVLGYDPKKFSKGRSPLEAISMGLEMSPLDFAFRMNLVTISEEEENYEDRRILDHSADEISTEEAAVLVAEIQKAFGNEKRRFYPGFSYRHCMLWENAPGSEKSEKIYDFTRPHDILEQKIGEYLPKGEVGEQYADMMRKSYDILNHHPLNEKRRREGKKPANSIWFWSPGKKPLLPNFCEKYNIKASVISAVDLIKGIGICAGMRSIDVEGATGNYHTNYIGKANAAIEAFREGDDFVYLHVEAPDECGHRAEIENKVSSIEKIDSEILAPVKSYLDETGEDYRILLLPDHPTPISRRTHTREAVPFVIFDSSKELEDGIEAFDEFSAEKSDVYIENGYTLINKFIN